MQPTCWLTPAAAAPAVAPAAAAAVSAAAGRQRQVHGGGGGGGGLLGGCSAVESCKPGQRKAGRNDFLLCLRYTLSALKPTGKYNSLQIGMQNL